jgi:dTDP-glucose 4,6-dehydratase
MVDVLVTGGAGFIGSHFVRYALAAHPDWRVTTLDTMGDGGQVENLAEAVDHPRHQFARGDIADAALAASLVARADLVVHFAAETGADRSIDNAEAFIRSDVYGTFVLLDAARRSGRPLTRFVQVSPDEVYGCREDRAFTETDELRPQNPYAATKAGADRLAYSFWATYGLPVTIARVARTYGPCQGAAHLVPTLIIRALGHLPVWVPADGQTARDWLHVRDHCLGLDTVIARGVAGEVYNVAGGRRLTDLDLARAILKHVGRADGEIDLAPGRRPGGRCCLDTAKVRALGWAPTIDLEQGLADTIAWYSAKHG